MFKLLSTPLKKPSEVDVTPLIILIQNTYSSSPDKFKEAVNEFSKQRNTAVWKFFENYETSLEIVYAYYDQLCALEVKIPVNELQINFKWRDAFDRGSIFGGKSCLTLTSLVYEKICVLFNIAGLQSSLAASQPFDSDEGLKKATKLLQQSAGIFKYIKGVTPVAIPSEPTSDLNQETLTTLSSLMAAQAQELFIMKAIKDNMKEQVIAKLCCQCEEMYAEVLRGMQTESLRNLWDKEWIPLVAGKQAGFHGLTQWYQSIFCRANKQIGEEITRLRWAIELFKFAQSRSGNPFLLEDFANRAQRNLTESLKDNEFIYNEIVPEVTSLKAPEKAQLAKELSLKTPMSLHFKDIFRELIPVELHRALLASEAKKNEVVNSEILKLREATQTLNAVLASFNLPAAIETTDSGTGLPLSLIEKSNDVRSKGGIEAVNTFMKELPELLKRNREILDEAERLLDEEQNSDNQLRSQFKERWTRTSSDNLTEMFRANARKYREAINNAVEADKIVRSKGEKYAKGINLLSKSPEEIQYAVPRATGTIDPNSSSVLNLKLLMQSVDKIKAERDGIESELKSANFNVKDEFLRALAQDGAIDEPLISLTHIGQVLKPLQIQVKKNIELQQSLIGSIQNAHAAFISENGTYSSSRDSLYSDLAKSYDCFIDLLGNLKEGTKFYNDLTQLLVVFQNKISDYCFARKTEKDELLKDLTLESSRQASIPTAVKPSLCASAMDIEHAPSLSGSVPYPKPIQDMPMAYGDRVAAPYPACNPTPLPESYSAYGTLPYPSNAYQYAGYPQGPLPSNFGTYPGTCVNRQGSYPNQPKPPEW